MMAIDEICVILFVFLTYGWSSGPVCIWVASLLLVSCMIEKLPPTPNWERIEEELDGKHEFVTSFQIDRLSTECFMYLSVSL